MAFTATLTAVWSAITLVAVAPAICGSLATRVHKSATKSGECVCPTSQAQQHRQPIPVNETSCGRLKADECKILRLLSFVTRPHGLLRTVFKDMLEIVAHGNIVEDDHLTAGIDDCFPNLPRAMRSQSTQSIGEQARHIQWMRTVVVNASTLIQLAIKSMYHPLEDADGSAYRYNSPLGQQYYDTAYFAFAHHLYCPIQQLASMSVDSEESVEQSIGRPACQWTCSGLHDLCREREKRLIRFLEKLISRLNHNVEQMLEMKACI